MRVKSHILLSVALAVVVLCAGVSAAVYPSPPSPRAVCLDGVDDNVALGSLGQSFQSISFEFWFEIDGFPPADTLQHNMFYLGTGGEIGMSTSTAVGLSCAELERS